MNWRVFRGAHLDNTDHLMLTAWLKIKLKVDSSDNSLSWHVLSARAQYFCSTIHSISSRFSAIIEEELVNWQLFKTAVNDAAQEAIGHCQQMPKNLWYLMNWSRLSNIIARHACGNMEEYRWLNIAHDESIRAYHQRYWNDEVRKLEDAAQLIDQCQVFQMLWQAKAGPHQESNHVKDQNVNILTTEAECMNHWDKHLQWLLNHLPTPAAKDSYDATTTITVSTMIPTALHYWWQMPML